MPKSTKNKQIPVNTPVVSKESVSFLMKAAKAGWISSSGPMVKEFEDSFAKFVGMKYGIAVSSGTAALHGALLSLNIKKGDEVIVPAFTMAACWLSILYVGAKPVFVDCDPETYNIDPKKIEEKITSKTKAIMIVHIYGHPCDMDSISKITKKHKLFLIEDAAEAHGAEYKKQKCGSFGDIACFSFYANKIIATGEGGMILTNDEALAKKARRYRDLCHSEEKRFVHDDIGYNYRFTNLQAAVGLGELKNIGKYIKKKLEIAKKYDAGLKNIEGLTLPITKPGNLNVYWMYSIVIDPEKFPVSKDKLRTILDDEYGIGTRDFFYGPHEQPVLKEFLGQERFPITEHIARNGFYLPSGLALTTKEIESVIKAVKAIAGKNQKKNKKNE